MLFDLRSPGRRVAIKIIYSGLALLIGGGLVLFGIGGATNGGGLLDAFKNDQGKLSNDAFVKRAAAQEKKTRVSPTAGNYAELARLRVQSAGFDDAKGVFTTAGKQQLALADAAWQASLKKVGDGQADPGVASVMQNAYAPGGLNEPKNGYEAAEIVIDSKGSGATAQLYVQLAQWAYLAKNNRQATLAGQKALSLASADDKEQIKGALDALKSQAKQADAATKTDPSPAGG